jgi:hypothetical protein
MATQNFQLIHWDGTKQKRVESQTMELKLGKLAIGSLADIKEIGGKLDIGGAIITNVGAPVDASDLASKGYADSAASGAVAPVQAEVDAVEAALAQELVDRAAGDASTLVDAKAYTDAEILAASGGLGGDISELQSDLAQEILDRQAGDTALQTSITTLQDLKDAQVVWVSKSGNDSTGNGGQHKPFASLTAALASITDATPSKRYVVLMHAGSYAEAGAVALKANVFVVGAVRDAVRITASSFTMASDFNQAAANDCRSGFTNVVLIGACDFNWQTVTSPAGKLYFNQVTFNSAVTLYGHNNAIAQAQFHSCLFYSSFTVSGINVGLHVNNIHFGNIVLNQHPNGGMATILNASGGYCGGTATLTASTNDFNRRVSVFAKNFNFNALSVNGPSAYCDLDDDSAPRQASNLTSSDGGNVVYVSSTVPHKSNERSIGDLGKQYLYTFSYVFSSTDSDLYVISMGNAYAAASTGRSIFVESDSYGLQPNVNGGDINITTAETSGTGVRGKIKLTGRQLDVSSMAVKNIADAVDAQDAVSKAQLDAAISAEQSARSSGDASTLSSAQAYADQKVADLVNGAPAILDTLKELSDALGADGNFAVTITNSIAAVQAEVDAEELARASAVTALEGDIAAEETRALAAEGALDTRLDVIEGSGAGSVAKAQLDAQAYADAAVLVEKGRAEAAESALQGEVDAVEADLAQEILDRAAAVSAEQSRAEAAELALQGEVDAVEADLAQELLDRAAADTTLQGNIDAVAGDLAQELLDRAAADTALQGEIDAVEADLAQELLDRAAAVAAVQAEVDAEEIRAAAAELALQGEIDAEETRALAAEAALQGEIDAEEVARAAADTALQGEIDALEVVVSELNLISKTADAAISAGQICYIKSNGNIDLADADLDMSDAALVIAAASIASGASGKVVIKEGTVVGGFSGLVPGKKCFVSKTAGEMVQALTGFASGNSVYCVGRAISATEIAFQPVYEFEY